MGGDHRSRLVEHRAAVSELVTERPDLTFRRSAAHWRRHLGSLWG